MKLPEDRDRGAREVTPEARLTADQTAWEKQQAPQIQPRQHRVSPLTLSSMAIEVTLPAITYTARFAKAT
jgi:hypothetical protein